MEVKYFKSTWGMTEGSIGEQLKKISEAGYDGVEANAPEDPEERKKFGKALRDYGLMFVGQQWTAGKTIEEHKQSFERQIRNNVELKPVMVNSHTGKDFYKKADNLDLIRFCDLVASKLGVKLTHETHRGRFSFCAAGTAEYLAELPELRLTADFSHWCCVSESLLDDQSEILNTVIRHCDHIHARIGHEEGPQVTDPRAPEWKEAVSKHLEWWNKIAQQRQEDRAVLLPVTVEFGPPNYMVTLPFSGKPVADLWETNLYMRELLRKNLIVNV